jgi:hypothetical protein
MTSADAVGAAGRDLETLDAVRGMDKIDTWTQRTILGVAALYAVIGVAAAGGNTINIVSGAILVGMAQLLFMGVRAVVLTPMRTARYKTCIPRIRETLQALPGPPAMAVTWASPPGGLAISQGNLFVTSLETQYRHLLLRRDQITSVKVERTYRAQTKGDYRRHILGSGGTYRSKTKVTTLAFLEIQYQLSPNAAVAWVSVPFGENRRDADSWVIAISRMKHGG